MRLVPALLISVLAFPALAQTKPARLIGTTPGPAPAGCAPAAALTAIQTWFKAINTGDSTLIARAFSPTFHVFSNGKFTPADTFFARRTIAELGDYLRRRARQHEQITLVSIQLNEWRERKLEFYDVVFTRTADDLGRNLRWGNGKGEFECGKGLTVLNLAPQ